MRRAEAASAATAAGEALEAAAERRRCRRLLQHLMLWTFLGCWLLAYGGVRSPDSEVVFRTAEALAARGTFALESDLPGWPGFGVAAGRDGRLYSIFGPAESVALAPLVAAASRVQRSAWYGDGFMPPAPSHYTGAGLRAFLTGVAPPAEERHAHALRFLLAWFNPAIAALTAGVLFLLLVRLSGSATAAAAVSVLYAFGTLALPYAGTFFSEPLATLAALGSLSLLVQPQAGDPWAAAGPAAGRAGGQTSAAAPPPPAPAAVAYGPGWRRLLGAGAVLGLGCAAHLSAALFAPFHLAYCALAAGRAGGRWRAGGRAALAFGGGLLLVLVLLGGHNWARFGSIWETGRTVPGLTIQYGRFVAPWRNVSGLLWSGGRGLLWYSPAVVCGALSWPCMRRRQALLADALAGMCLFRLVFIAARSDWSGGFCLGPRYLVMLLPFVLIPCAYPLAAGLRRRPGRWLASSGLVTAACVAEQLYLSTGEVFSFQHWIRLTSIQRQIDVFGTERIYRAWEYSPLLHLLAGRRGPWPLQRVPAGNWTVWIALAAAASLLIGLIWCRWLAWERRHAPRRGAAGPCAGGGSSLSTGEER